MLEGRNTVTRQARIVSFNEARDVSRRRDKSVDQRTSRSSHRNSVSYSREESRSRFAYDPDERDSRKARVRSKEVESDRGVESAISARECKRRERTKARASKMFEEQFSDLEAASHESEEAPRAALYEGKMGSTHRKSARMQRASSSGSSIVGTVGSRFLSWFSEIPITSRFLKAATAAICVLLTAVFLYTPAQQYYQAQRERDRLAVEYSTIEKRNDMLDVQNDILVSDAGMEDAVRQKYGYVKSGEETAIVTGLSDNATDTSRDSENIEANVLSSSVKAPEEWYTPFLDAFFGVE